MFVIMAALLCSAMALTQWLTSETMMFRETSRSAMKWKLLLQRLNTQTIMRCRTQRRHSILTILLERLLPKGNTYIKLNDIQLWRTIRGFMFNDWRKVQYTMFRFVTQMGPNLGWAHKNTRPEIFPLQWINCLPNEQCGRKLVRRILINCLRCAFVKIFAGLWLFTYFSRTLCGDISLHVYYGHCWEAWV